MTETPSQYSWKSLARKRLRPVGDESSRVSRLWFGASWLALVAGAAWFTSAWLRPLPEPEAVMPSPIKLLESPARAAASIDERRAALKALWMTNRFAADGLPWPRVRLVRDQSEPSDLSSASVASLNAQIGSNEGEQPTTIKAAAQIAPPVELPAEIKSALALLELRGVYVDVARMPVAMVGMGPSRASGVIETLREGEDFLGPNDKEALWRVESIDVPSQRVVLSRSGVHTALSMYALHGQQKVPEIESSLSIPVVVSASEDEIVQALREAGIAAEDVAHLTEMMRASTLPDEAEQEHVASYTESALTDVIAASPESGMRAGPPQMPAALRDLLEQMAAQSMGSKRNLNQHAEALHERPD